MANFDVALQYVLANEKDLVNNPHDAGKITKYGISLRFVKGLSREKLREYGFLALFDAGMYEQIIIDLTMDQARSIYLNEFWKVAPFEKIGNQDQCTYIFDMAINLGIAPAIKCAQRACWAVMRGRTLIDDGILGPLTLQTLQQCGPLLMAAMRSERAGYYRLTVEKNDANKVFLQGWLNRAYEFNR